jgi:hypothetical protein
MMDTIGIAICLLSIVIEGCTICWLLWCAITMIKENNENQEKMIEFQRAILDELRKSSKLP